MKRLTRCLVCGSRGLTKFFDLGKQPLANNYLSDLGTQETYPLALQYCHVCSHTQLTHSVNPEKLFMDYAYVSGTTATLNNWFYEFSQRFKNDKPGRIADIAGNDGSLLKHFKAMGWETLNIDPAVNLQSFNQELGIPMINEFWNERTAKLYGQFDVLTAFMVLPHTPTPASFVRGLRRAIKPNGRVYIATSQADMLQAGQYDVVYHEHVSYFSEGSMRLLLESNGFKGWEITITREKIHGGSMLIEIKRPYHDFERRANLLRDFLKTIPVGAIGYGAAAKGVVMINDVGLDLKMVIDENPLKQGKYIPGTTIPIVAPKELKKLKGNLDIVVLAWNFADEIMSKVRKLRPKNKDKFYIPLPWPKIIE